MRRPGTAHALTLGLLLGAASLYAQDGSAIVLQDALGRDIVEIEPGQYVDIRHRAKGDSVSRVLIGDTPAETTSQTVDITVVRVPVAVSVGSTTIRIEWGSGETTVTTVRVHALRHLSAKAERSTAGVVLTVDLAAIDSSVDVSLIGAKGKVLVLGAIPDAEGKARVQFGPFGTLSWPPGHYVVESRLGSPPRALRQSVFIGPSGEPVGRSEAATPAELRQWLFSGYSPTLTLLARGLLIAAVATEQAPDLRELQSFLKSVNATVDLGGRKPVELVDEAARLFALVGESHEEFLGGLAFSPDPMLDTRLQVLLATGIHVALKWVEGSGLNGEPLRRLSWSRGRATSCSDVDVFIRDFVLMRGSLRRR